LAAGLRPSPHPLGSLLHSSRDDFEDHKDIGGERKRGAEGELKRMGYGKGRAEDSDGEVSDGGKERDEA